jgi:hypothetical protein
VLALVVLHYIVERSCRRGGNGWCVSAPGAAILLPAPFFLSVVSPDAAGPNALICLGYGDAVLHGISLFVLEIWLVRQPIAGTARPPTA